MRACPSAAPPVVMTSGSPTYGTATPCVRGASYAMSFDVPLEEIAMRCLHHVFLRGGLALLLLAAGVGAPHATPASAGAPGAC